MELIPDKQRRAFLTQRLLSSPVFKREGMTKKERRELFKREEVLVDKERSLRLEIKVDKPVSWLFIDTDFDDVKDIRSQVAIVALYFIEHGKEIKESLGIDGIIVPVFCWNGVDEDEIIKDDLIRRTVVSSLYAIIGAM
jgi:hypothetical protein